MPKKPPNDADRAEQALWIATELYCQRPSWVLFFREVFGVGGVVARLFPSAADRAEFERSPQGAEIQGMLAELRSETPPETAAVEDREVLRVITVRLPKSLHESLRTEAHELEKSMNRLCIEKLTRPNFSAELSAALAGMVERYTSLANSGDCGNWNPEEEPEVIAARAALAKANEESQ